MLQFSANLSLLFTEVPLIDRFQQARAAGFEAVEIQFPYELPAQTIKQQLQQHELKLVLFNVPADTLLQGGEGLACVPEKQHQFKQALEQAARYADILSPNAINILPGRCLNPARLPEYLETFRHNLYDAAETFQQQGIKVVFEAVNTHDMPGFIIHSSRQMLDVMAQLKHPALGLQYDIYHMQKMQEDCAGFLSRHMNKVAHIQFADCPGRGQPGTGQTDFSSLFRIISESDYCGWTGAEYIPSGKTTDSLNWLRTYQPATL